MIPFHRFLIRTAILFCGGFALWAFRMYQTTNQPGFLALFAGFAVATVALCYYLINLRRFLGR